MNYMLNLNKTTIIKNKKNSRIKLKEPILLVGLPGLGNVGTIVADLLIKQFKGKPLAKLYSNHFPHQVLMLKNGGLRLLNNRFYLIDSFNKKNNLIVLTGDTQAITSEGQFDVNLKILDYFKNELKGKFIFTIGGYTTMQEDLKDPKVFGNVTNKNIIDKFKKYNIVFNKSRGAILGSLGLLLAFAKMQKLEGLCLMGETKYPEIDPAAVKAIVDVLNKIFKITIDTKDLDNLIKSIDSSNANISNNSNIPSPLLNNEENSQPSYIR